MLMLEGACRHAGDITVNKVVRDLSDIETAYGKCGCGAWVIRTTWFGSRDAECYETRMMSPREVEVLIGPTMPVESKDAHERRADWLHDFQLTNGQ
jgi:hypothetical protein